MPKKTIIVKVPATTGNLGPGFDCLGLAFDLWNEARFSLGGNGIQVRVVGEGQAELSTGTDNLVAHAALQAFHAAGQSPPADLQIDCTNRIPLRSGLGSSGAATLTGLLGGNALLGSPLSKKRILQLAADIEGHPPDNVAASLFGGLTLVALSTDEILLQRVEVPAWWAVVIMPAVNFSTKDSREALPLNFPREDVVFNISRTAMVVQAFSQGDLSMLRKVMRDRIHQSYRLPLLPGAAEAIQAAQDAGCAAALSGAGPSVVAFTDMDPEPIQAAMQAAFSKAGVDSRSFILHVSMQGASVETV